MPERPVALQVVATQGGKTWAVDSTRSLAMIYRLDAKNATRTTIPVDPADLFPGAANYGGAMPGAGILPDGRVVFAVGFLNYTQSSFETRYLILAPPP